MIVKWAAFTTRQKQIIAGTAVLVAIQILLMVRILGWTRPPEQRGGAVRAEVAELSRKIEEAQMILRGELVLRRALSDTVERLEKLKDDLPSEADRYAWAYEYISRRATDAGVTIDNVEELVYRGNAPAGQSAETYEISVTARCSYSQLVDFIWRLERDNQLLRLREVSISASPSDRIYHQVRFVAQWPAALTIERGHLNGETGRGVVE